MVAMIDHHAEDEARWVALMRERDKAQAALIDAALVQAKLVEERDEARAEVERLRSERDEARSHTSTAAFMRIERERDDARKALFNAVSEVERLRAERDEARADVSRREREHAALLETAQKALATTEAERDEARAEVRVLLAEIDAERRERASAVLAAVEAAEERGAEWMLAHAQSEVWSKDDYGVQWQDVRSPSEICRDARGAGAEWQRDLDGCNKIIDRLKARLGDK